MHHHFVSLYYLFKLLASRPGRITSLFVGAVATSPSPYSEVSSELGYDTGGATDFSAGKTMVVWTEKHASVNQTFIRAFDTKQMAIMNLKLDGDSTQQVQAPTRSRFKPSSCASYVMYQQ